ncbi:hypothetical protein MOXK02_13080 [Moraxella sp. K02]
MLILTRRVGETLMIGDEVSVTVLGVKGNQVRLGVNAPKDIAVHREEIYQRILHERTGHERMGYDNHPVDFAAHDRIGQDRSGFGAASLEAFPQERSKPSQLRNSDQQMRHLENRVENRGFGQTNNNFNPAFDPFEDDYFNR